MYLSPAHGFQQPCPASLVENPIRLVLCIELTQTMQANTVKFIITKNNKLCLPCWLPI